MSDPVWDPYADHAQMENHWWWRPGWQVGTRFYAWHITLDGQGDLHRLMDGYVRALEPFSTLDPVPRKWRHITLQGLGHVEDLTDQLRDAAVTAVAARLAALEPITAKFQRAAIFKEAIALPPSHPEAFALLRQEIRAGISDAWGHTPESAAGFRAHTSVAYSNDTSKSQGIRDALDASDPKGAEATFSQVRLIRMHRDRQAYEWQDVTAVEIG